jgi:hypothetical protein
LCTPVLPGRSLPLTLTYRFKSSGNYACLLHLVVEPGLAVRRGGTEKVETSLNSYSNKEITVHFSKK